MICIGMGQLNKSLAGTITFMILFSLFVQASEGATYGVVPFTSARCMGIIAGFVGAGGNAGASVNLAIWFRSSKYETYDGITYMGILIVCVSMLTFTLHFPPWGSMDTHTISMPMYVIPSYVSYFAERNQMARFTDAPALPPAPTKPAMMPMQRALVNGTTPYVAPSDACTNSEKRIMKVIVPARDLFSCPMPMPIIPSKN